MRSRGQLRDQILTAARAEFAAFGLAGARIDRIARAAEASKERLYAHFGDKEALFREVVAADGAEFFRTLTVRPEAVPEFVGDVHDLAQRHPEHLRMMTWARLEGVRFEQPPGADPTMPAQAVAAIRAAQRNGDVDPAWNAEDLLVLLLGVGLAWSHWPDPAAMTSDPVAVRRRRAAAVEAAARIVAAHPR